MNGAALFLAHGAIVASLLVACGDGAIEDGSGGASAASQGTGTEATGGTAGTGDASSSTGEEDVPPPTVSAGQDQTVTWPIDRVPLQALATNDETVRWEQISGPSPVVIREANRAVALATGLRVGETTLRITVENEEGETASDEVTLHVLPASTEPATPVEWAAALPRPTFRAGHDLPPLTRTTGPHLLAFEVELAERYGYTLDLGVTSPEIDGDLADDQGHVARRIALKKLDPGTFKLSAQVHRPLADDASDFHERYPGMRLRAANGEPNGGFSPEAPDELFEEVAEASASRLRALRQMVEAEVPGSPTIEVIINGGGYGLGVWGLEDDHYLDDALVRTAIEARFDLEAGEDPSEDEMFQYISERKAHQEGIVTAAHVEANPGGIYAFARTWSWGLKERDPSWWRFAWDFPEIADLSSPPGIAVPVVWYGFAGDSRFDGDADALSQLTNAQAWQQEQGAPLQYLSTSGGWPGSGAIADDDLYMGYLKAAYAVGVIGGTAAYFDDPGWGDEDAGASDEMPNWVRQLVTLGEVHALFSHLEGYLRYGTLLPGPHAHRWSTGKPAYELDALTGGVPDPGVRVVARRNQGGDGWLVTLWAFEGDDRDVAVDLDELLGELDFTARVAGSVYLVTLDEDGEVTQQLLDPDPMLPTDTLVGGDDFR